MNDPHAHRPHVLSRGALLGTAGALAALTVLTVSTSRLQLGSFNIVLALAIAGLKATLVALFFMHLAWQRRAQAVALAGAVFFAVLFVGFVVFDTTQYQGDVRAAAAAERAPAAAPEGTSGEAHEAHEAHEAEEAR